MYANIILIKISAAHTAAAAFSPKRAQEAYDGMLRRKNEMSQNV